MTLYNIHINGLTRTIECEPERLLIDVLREDLRLTGTKKGCGIGSCGSCTVLIDGKPRRACRVKMIDIYPSPSLPLQRGGRGSDSRFTIHDPRITTIEGLSIDGKLHPIQQAFIDCGAIQCGFCTPGMVLTAKALLDESPNPTRDEIKKALAGNLCRCTGYQQIFEAVEAAAKIVNRKP